MIGAANGKNGNSDLAISQAPLRHLRPVHQIHRRPVDVRPRWAGDQLRLWVQEVGASKLNDRRIDASCGACRYWLRRPDLCEPFMEEVGECRRVPPPPLAADEHFDKDTYKVVEWVITSAEHDYCGAFDNYYDGKEMIEQLSSWLRRRAE